MKDNRKIKFAGGALFGALILTESLIALHTDPEHISEPHAFERGVHFFPGNLVVSGISGTTRAFLLQSFNQNIL